MTNKEKYIVGIPESEYDYEFMICEEKDDCYQWIANFEYWNDDADKLCKSNENFRIIHNIRIAHKQKKIKN